MVGPSGRRRARGPGREPWPRPGSGAGALVNAVGEGLSFGSCRGLADPA